MKKILLAILSFIFALSTSTVFADAANYIAFNNQLLNALNLQAQGQSIQNPPNILPAKSLTTITYGSGKQAKFIITVNQPLSCTIDITVDDGGGFSMNAGNPQCQQLISGVEAINNTSNFKITFSTNSNSSIASGISSNNQPGSLMQN